MIVVKGTFCWPVAFVNAAANVSEMDRLILTSSEQAFTVLFNADFDQLPDFASFDALAECAVYAYEDRILESYSPAARIAGEQAFEEAGGVNLAENACTHSIMEVTPASDLQVMQCVLLENAHELFSGDSYILIVGAHELSELLKLVYGDDAESSSTDTAENLEKPDSAESVKESLLSPVDVCHSDL